MTTEDQKAMLDQMRQDLADCKAEVPKMDALMAKMKDLISDKSISGADKLKLAEQIKKLTKDKDNYMHMLNEAEDLKKSWDQNYTDEDNGVAVSYSEETFTSNAVEFDVNITSHTDMANLKTSGPKNVLCDVVEGDDEEPDSNTPQVNMPMQFEFGLLKKHEMGGWTSSGAGGDDSFSFTFKWDDEKYGNRDFLDTCKLKCTSIVVLYDDQNTIVTFDVEPGYLHQWGYGRQEFISQGWLQDRHDRLRCRAYIKNWTNAHEFEVGRYTIDLLRQSRGDREKAGELLDIILANQQQKLDDEKVVSAKINDLNTKMEVLLEEKETLEETTSTLRIEVETKTIELKKEQKRVLQLKADKAALEKEKTRLEEEVGTLKDEKADLETQLSVNFDPFSNGTQRSMNDDMGQIPIEHGSTDSTQVRAPPKNLQPIIDGLQAELEDIKEKLAVKTKELEDETAAHEKTQEDLADTKQKLEDAKAENDRLKGELEDAKNDFKKAEEDAKKNQDELNTEIEKLKTEITETKTTITTHETTISELNIEITGMQTKAGELEESNKEALQEKDNEIAAEKKKSEALEKKVADLERSLKNREDELAEGNKLMDAIKNDKDILEKKISDLEEKIDEIEKALAAKDAEIEELKTKLHAAETSHEAEKDALGNQIEDLQSAVVDAKSEIVQKDVDIHALNVEINEHKETQEKLKVTIKTKDNENEDLRAKLNAANEKLREANKTIEDHADRARKAIELLKPIAGATGVDVDDDVETGVKTPAVEIEIEAEKTTVEDTTVKITEVDEVTETVTIEDPKDEPKEEPKEDKPGLFGRINSFISDIVHGDSSDEEKKEDKNPEKKPEVVEEKPVEKAPEEKPEEETTDEPIVVPDIPFFPDKVEEEKSDKETEIKEAVAEVKEEVTEVTITTTEVTEEETTEGVAVEEEKSTKEGRRASSKPSNKKLDKFDLSMGLKSSSKKEKSDKPGFFSKMFCASKPATNESETIQDPQINQPPSPTLH